MNEIIDSIRAQFDVETVRAIIKALLIVLVGLTITRLVKRRFRSDNLQAQQNLILKRVLNLVLLAITFAWALSTVGLELGVVLGAAGVLTVALGFAAQTSVSNLISGAFLMAERPFSIADIIRVGDITGEVLSIDSLSVKIRTFDNLLVRVPNETMLKANIVNLSHFPIRRYEMLINVAYGTNIDQLKKLLKDIARRNHLCLNEPLPVLIFLGFGEFALEIQFNVWSKRENFLEMRTSMHEQIDREFRDHGIVIPFPQRVLHIDSKKDTPEGSSIVSES